MAEMKKVKVGQVLSNKMQKTIVVRVESHRHHPIYKKTIRNIVKYKVHDENNECSIGDTVRIIETRPLSKEKRWRVSEILIKAATIEVKPEEIEPKTISEETTPQPEAKVEQPIEAAENKLA
jgi:small subunit ribosomal protein S17